MDPALRIVVALVLLGAAAAKLRDRRALVAAVGDHGVPPALRPAAATALVLAELALGVLILIPATARAAGVGVAVLGVVFAGSLGLMRLRGRRRAPCGCFGGTRERPVSWLIVRALLLAAAGVVIAGGWLDRDADAVALLTAGVAALVVAVVVLTVLVLALFRQVGVLEARLGPRAALELEDEGPPLGRPAPPPRRSRAAGASCWRSRRAAAGCAPSWSRPSPPCAATACPSTPSSRTRTPTRSPPTACPAPRSWCTPSTGSWRARAWSTRSSRSRS